MPDFNQNQQTFLKLLNFRSSKNLLRFLTLLFCSLKLSAILMVLFLSWSAAYFIFPQIKSTLTENNPILIENNLLSNLEGYENSNAPAALASHLWQWIVNPDWGLPPQATLIVLILITCFTFLVLRLLEQIFSWYNSELQLSKFRQVIYQNEFLKIQQQLIQQTSTISQTEELLAKTGEVLLAYDAKQQPAILAIILLTLIGIITKTALFMILCGLCFLIFGIQVFLNTHLIQKISNLKIASENDYYWQVNLYKVMPFSKGFGLAHTWLEKLSYYSKSYLSKRIAIAICTLLKQHCEYFAIISCIGFVTLLGWISIKYNFATGQDIFLSGSLSILVVFYFKTYLDCRQEINSGLPYVAQLFINIEDKNGFYQEESGTLKFSEYNTIYFDTVTIKNKYDSHLVKNLSLTIKRNEKIGFAGLNKEQKTALGLLISCALIPDEGELRFGNTNAKNLSPEQPPREVSFVPARFEIIADTLHKIISNYSDFPELTKIINAAKSTNIHSLIMSYKNEYNTFYDSADPSFNSLFQFLLGFARAIYLETKTLVIEEPESSVGDDLIQSAYHKTLSEKTVIFLGGSEITFSQCDRIYLFKNQHIVATGTHKSLLLQYPEYYLIKE